MSSTVRKVRLSLIFYADIPTDDQAGDAAADRIGYACVAAVEDNIPEGVYPGSVTVEDWEQLDEVEAEA